MEKAPKGTKLKSCIPKKIEKVLSKGQRIKRIHKNNVLENIYIYIYKKRCVNKAHHAYTMNKTEVEFMKIL